jgi:predicted DNA-binding transcriptional regulator AlpA
MLAMVTTCLTMSVTSERADNSGAILAVEQVAILCSRSVVTVRRNVRDCRFPAPMRVGRRVGWPRSVIEQWLREQETKLANEHKRIRAQLEQMYGSIGG